MTPLLEETRDRTVVETCQILSCSPQMIYKLLSRGELEGYKIGRSRRITFDSIQRLRRGNLKAGTPS